MILRVTDAFSILLVLLCCKSAHSTTGNSGFMTAVKNLFFGPDGQNSENRSLNVTSRAVSEGSVTAAGQQLVVYPHAYSYSSFNPSTRAVGGNACNLPQQIGTGPYRIPRWYYNPARMRCELFYWSGCCGNGNNFQTFQNCQQACEGGAVFSSPPVTLSVANSECCVRPLSTGHGHYRIPRWYFDVKTGSCVMFLYNGYGGTSNNFETAAECIAVCRGSVTLLTTGVDPCSQEHDQGVGAMQLPRYFFNHRTKLCEQFTYFGSAGNRNNFPTLEECQRQCPESPNPCAYGSTSQPQCSAHSVLGTPCGSHQFCHVGPTATTTVCCNKPPTGDRCSQPLNIGVGNANLQRWYFNPLTQQCQQCIYKGFQGNENNFLTLQECENACFVNPCSRGVPYRSQGVNVQCSALNQAVCPAGYYCHIGIDSQTSVCCQALASKISDICKLPKINGSGNATLQRFYFNSKSGKCEAFFYGGLAGNQNNFLSKEECERKCQWIASCPSGESAKDLKTNSAVYCKSTKDCPRSYFCYENGTGHKVCCPSTYPELCPMNNSASFLNRTSLTRIITCTVNSVCPIESRCLIDGSSLFFACCKEEKHPCSMPLSVGRGQEKLPRFAYDSRTERCVKFIYKGTKGNRNNFLTEEQCLKACPGFKNPCKDNQEPLLDLSGRKIYCASNESICGPNYLCHKGVNYASTVCCPKVDYRKQTVDPCEEPINNGQGNRTEIRFGYNALHHRCVPFVYAGFHGNANNFETLDECVDFCVDKSEACEIGKAPSPRILCKNSTCPVDYFCHIGMSFATTQCCLGGGNPCNEPMIKGQGKASLTRYYYDTATRQCLTFNYFGLKGNSNNFLSKEACEAKCPVWVNPCGSGDPLIGADQRPQQCHQKSPCPYQYFCHIGFDDATTVCCPSTGDPCTVPLSVGQGEQKMTRWYYNAQTRQCQQFNYRGLGGNENNFLLRDHCESTCPVWVNPCITGEPILASNNRPRQCSPLNADSCPLTHWCHPGVEPATMVCCPGRTDPCSQPRSEGEGQFSQSRWYFDENIRRCTQFNFRGLKGNANNFLSQRDCEAKCPVFIDPCPTSYGGNWVQQRTSCSSSNFECPATFWCHVGGSLETTLCCPNAGDPCTQPAKEQGIGELKLTRWTFDAAQKKCLPFEYHGMKGNQNNFLSRETCEARCPVFENPCKIGEPYMVENRPQICNPQSLCAANYYCHIGAEDQYYCCPSQGGDPCGQAMDRGRGSAQLQRWYWNVATQQCLPFIYCGMKGTQNNFLTQQDCERTCYELDNPCALGNPQLGSDSRPITCSVGVNTCAPSYWCHIGAVTQTTVCCPGRVEGDAICQQPMSMGSGEANLQRWYFDALNRKCVPFIYKGHFGNQNNFLSVQQCEQTCAVFVNPCSLPVTLPPQLCSATANTCGSGMYCHIGLTPQTTICCPSEGNPCTLPAARGTGTGFLERWFFNVQTGTCQPFTYTGLKGNQNNFLTREQCEEECGPDPCPEGRPFLGADGRPQSCSATSQVNTCPASYWCHVGADSQTTVCCPGASANPCNLPMSTGEGTASLERYYFDSTSRTCRPFIYRGLKGNQNNFPSLRACQLQCQPLENPCIGQPATTAAGQVLFCSSTNKDNCPVNFWCHVGATPETTVCCPGATNPCSVPLAPGTGNAGLSRWYYNPDDRECQSFQYNGKRGNQNNFETQQECARTCPVFENPCMGDVAKDAKGRPRTCNPIVLNSCGSGYFCLAGDPSIQSSSYCCPKLSEDPCNVYLSEGEGLEMYSRWYYSPREGECYPFSYRGKKGNENNFLTKQICEETCQPVSNACFGGDEPLRINGRIVQCSIHSCPHTHYCHMGENSRSSVCCERKGNICDQQLMIGVGDAKLARWYYSSVEDDCLPFNYSGLAGNENNFLTKASCQVACPGYRGFCPHGKPLVVKGKVTSCGIDTACPKDFICHVTKKESKSVCCPDPAFFCLLPRDPGPCGNMVTKYGYNRLTGICQKFSYGGCTGNLNNFASLEACTEVCCEKGY